MSNEYFNTYQQVTISFAPVASLIHRAFPLPNIKRTTDEKGLPIPITRQQYNHAWEITCLQNGIYGTAAKVNIIKTLEALRAQAKLEIQHLNRVQERIAHRQQITGTSENLMKVLDDYTNIVVDTQTKAALLEEKIKKLTEEQHELIKKQMNEWNDYECEYKERIVEAIEAQGVKMDPNIVKNIMHSKLMLSDLLARFKKSNFTVPKKFVENK